MAKDDNIYKLHQALLSKNGTSIKDFALNYLCDHNLEEFESKQSAYLRKAQRYLKEIKDKDFPVVNKRNRYYYDPQKISEYNADFRKLEFKFANSLFFSALYNGLTKNVELLPLKPDNLPISEQSGYKDLISYENYDYELTDPAFFMAAINSFAQKKNLLINYRSGNGQEESFNLQIIKIFHKLSKWYLLAHCVERAALRIYLFSRIQKVKLTENDYQNLNYTVADIHSKTSAGYGICQKDLVSVTVRFYGVLTESFSRRIFHIDQTICQGINDKGEKYLEFTFPAGSSSEIVGKVLGYGALAEIVSPPEYRDIWLKNLRSACEKYLADIHSSY